MPKYAHYMFPIVIAYWCPYITRSWTFGMPGLIYQTHLCRLPTRTPPPCPPTFYRYNFLGSFFLSSILKLCPWCLAEKCSPQAALPFAITLIKSATLRSDFGLVFSFAGQLQGWWQACACHCVPLHSHPSLPAGWEPFCCVLSANGERGRRGMVCFFPPPAFFCCPW